MEVHAYEQVHKDDARTSPAGKGPVTKGDFSEVLNRRPVVVTYTKDERDSFLARCKGIAFLLWSLFLKCGFRYKGELFVS